MKIGSGRLIVPEVVQTSAMDCGPASLKCLLGGFGIRVSYGRLREACQTDADGTSIDTMEEVAIQLGLEAQQIMLPPDYVCEPGSKGLPAIVVVQLPTGLTHFVVAWRSHRSLVQVMDPAVGRRWLGRNKFLSSLYVHTLHAPVASWREWATSDRFLVPLGRKLAEAGVTRAAASRLVSRAASDADWRSLAGLEAATRALEAMVRSGGIGRGREATRALERLFETAHGPTGVGRGAISRKDIPAESIPNEYWSAQPAPVDVAAEQQILFRGAVLVHASERRAERQPARLSAPASPTPELVAALDEPATRPGWELLRLLGADGARVPLALGSALFLATAGVVLEAVLYRSLFDIGQEFGLARQRLGIMGVLLIFLIALLLLEFPLAHGLLRMGRHLEARLRLAFLRKIPRLGDRYFHSRLTSDMAERSHSLHRIRLLPDLGAQLLRSTFELALTVAGIVWLDRGAAKLAIPAALLALALPLMAQPLLAERDMRVRNHAGALSRFYMDALLGLVPLRTHRAERAVRREHERLLGEWARAGISLQRIAVAAEGLQFFAGFGLAAWLLLNHFARVGQSGGALLLVYWSLNLPTLGQEVALVAWQYPAHRSVTLRLLEPLGAKEEAAEVAEPDQRPRPPAAPVTPVASGVRISIEDVSVRAAGHTILERINLAIEPGEHLAIVGPSGAGKSSLVGLLLGWHRPASGAVVVDGQRLEGGRLEQLRHETAWVDPAVQLWNRSIFDNLRYGAPDHCLPGASVLTQAGLEEILERMPDGLQTALGEGGGLVSGGEGQRVRLGRAMLRPGVRLAILDEPFRGLDHSTRRELLANARNYWREITLLCITHDVGETLQFDRVLVVERGRIAEQGRPAELASRSASRYRALIDAEDAVREGLWRSRTWRRLRLEGGRLFESAGAT